MFARLEKYLNKITTPATIAAVGVLFLITPAITHAAAGSYVEAFLYKIIVSFFGWLAGAGGSVLDFGINEMVIGFGSMYLDKGLGETINALWVIIRDIFNLTFIFGLVFIGLRMIFGSDSNSRKMLISLILAALMVNFSLFITKFVVDFSNIAAVQLVNTFEPTAAGKPSISASFTSIMGSATLFESKDAFDKVAGGAGFVYIFGTLIVLLVMTFVFFAGGILLIIRFAALNLYMLMSPIMFIGMVFPQAAGVAKEFWSGFLGKAFFAPAYILMLYISHKILASFSITGSGSFAKTFSADKPADITAVLPPFILTTVFLIASIVVAQKMGATGANTAIAAGNYLKGKARNTALAPARKVARVASGTVAAQAEKANNYLQTSRTGRNIKRAISIASLGSFTERDRLAAIEAGKKAKFGGSYSYQDDQDFKKKAQIRENVLVAEADRKKRYEQIEEDLHNPIKSATELGNALDSLGKLIKEMTKEEKENMGIDKLTDKNIALHLSDSDIENLDKSGKFSANDIRDIKKARGDAYTAVAVEGNTLHATSAHKHDPSIKDRQRQSIANRGVKEVGKMPLDVFKQVEMYDYLTPAMVEERMRNGVTNKDLKEMREQLSLNLGIGLTDLPSSRGSSYVNDPWTKWETGNSTYAAQLFNA